MAKKKAVEPVTNELSEIEIGKLARVVAQHDGGAFEFASEDYFKELIDKGFVEVNVAMATDAGDVPARPTEAGIKLIKDNAVSEVSTPPVATQFAVLSGIPLPEVKRGGGGGRKGPRGSKYPFDTMENGQSFFVAATEEMPNPAKTLASTASTFAKKYATENGTREITRKGETKTVPAYNYTRKFQVRAMEHEGVAGAMVWRHDGAPDPE